MLSTLITSLAVAIAAPNPCPDVNGDGIVDVSDMLIVLMEWGPCSTPDCPDFTGNEQVDTSDLLYLLGAWDAECVTFDPLTDRHHNLEPFAQAFWQTGPKRVFIVSNSIGVARHGSRLTQGFLLAMDHPAGYSSVFWGAGPNSGGLWAVAGLLGGGFQLPSKAFSPPVFSDHTDGDGDYYGGVPIAGSMMHLLGHDGSAPDGWATNAGGNLRRAQLQPGRFSAESIVDDWITGANISMQVGITYLNEPTTGSYVSSFTVKNGTGNGIVHHTFDVHNGEYAHGGPPRQGINLCATRVPITTDQGASGLRLLIAPTDDWFAGTRWFGLSGFKVNNEDHPNGLQVATIAESTWTLAAHANTAPASSGVKSYTPDDLKHFISSVIDGDDDVPNFIFFEFNSQQWTPAQYATHLNAIRQKYLNAFSGLGLAAPRMLWCASWPTDEVGNNSAEAHAQALFEFTQSNLSDTSMYNRYAVYEGLLLDGDSPEQTQWAQANGFDAVPTNGGLLDFTHENFGLNGDWIHPGSPAQVFLHMFVLRSDLKAIAEQGVSNGRAGR